jgi:hypothetical protein
MADIVFDEGEFGEEFEPERLIFPPLFKPEWLLRQRCGPTTLAGQVCIL